MQSGTLVVSEYGPHDDPVGYIEPAGKPAWIIWHYKDGRVELYTKRKANGAVIGEPVVISKGSGVRARNRRSA